MSASRKESTYIRQSIEEPAYLPVGTEVSAKYRGAFCEANIKSVKKLVKCKVNFENGGGNSTVMDDAIIGNLRVGSDIKVKVQDGQDKAGTLVKITDSSTYTVIFDDGDERTLKRTSLCIKGEKHFNESETLDHLPLTDPENFGTPVMQQGKKPRKGRRSSLSLDENNDTDDLTVRRKLSVKDENSLEKVVLINFTEKKKTFQLPVLLLSSSEIRGDLKSPDNVLVRSFKDGKQMEVNFKDVKEFSKESAMNSILTKGENPGLKSAVENALKYLETDQLPENWNDESLVEAQHKENGEHSSCSEAESDGDENDRNIFLEKLNKFLDEKGTPLQRVPVLAHRDLDLYKLYRIVLKMHGMEKVESWQSVYKKMNIPVVSSASAYHIRTAYERYLYDFEVHCREAEQIEKGKMRLKLPQEDENSKLANSNHETETPVVSDSEKDNKNSKIISIIKSPSKRGRYVRKAKPDRTQSLKSPSSPACAPRSPCSPRSVGSVSPSECTGSPSEPNVCDARELRAKTESIPNKNALKVSGITDDSCETIANSCKKIEILN